MEKMQLIFSSENIRYGSDMDFDVRNFITSSLPGFAR